MAGGASLLVVCLSFRWLASVIYLRLLTLGDRGIQGPAIAIGIIRSGSTFSPTFVDVRKRPPFSVLLAA